MVEDVFNALKITVGEAVVPALIWMVDGLNAGFEAMGKLIGRGKELNGILDDHEEELKNSSMSWEASTPSPCPAAA